MCQQFFICQFFFFKQDSTNYTASLAFSLAVNVHLCSEHSQTIVNAQNRQPEPIDLQSWSKVFGSFKFDTASDIEI